MRKIRLGAIVALTAIAISAVFASSAFAFPSETSPCSACHSGANVPVTATLASTVGTTATYNASAPGADAIAVFSGATKVATILSSSGKFAVATGKTYTVFAVKGPTTGNGLGSASVSPVAATLDLTAPSTLSNTAVSYSGVANVKLTATDNIGGSGVAHTYYILDSGVQTQGTALAVTAVGAHALEYWSVDVAGNIETHKFANFSVTASTTVATSIALSTKSTTLAAYGNALSIVGTLTTNGVGLGGQKVVLQTSADGVAFANSAVTATTTVSGAFSLRVVPTRKTWYRAVFAGTASYVGATTGSVFVLPRAFVSTPVAPATMSRAKAAAVYGFLKPRYVAGTYPVRVYLWRLVAGKWKAYGFANAKSSNYSSYTKYVASVKFAYAGKWRVRAYHAADARYAESWSTGYDVVTVK